MNVTKLRKLNAKKARLCKALGKSRDLKEKKVLREMILRVESHRRKLKGVDF